MDSLGDVSPEYDITPIRVTRTESASKLKPHRIMLHMLIYIIKYENYVDLMSFFDNSNPQNLVKEKYGLFNQSN